MSKPSKAMNELFAQIEYVALRTEGASLNIASAHISHKWNVYGRTIMEAEMIVSNRMRDKALAVCGTTDNNGIH